MKLIYQLSFGLLLLCASPISYAQTYVIPHVADGGGWQTTLVLTNTTTSATTAALTCRKETSGGVTTTWNLALQETATLSNLSLAGAGTLFLHTAGTDSATSVGWCELDSDSGVQAYAVFSRTNMSPVQDGTAPASEATGHVVLPFDNASGVTTSVAIANPGASSETVAASIQLVDGTMTQTSLGSVPAHGHMAFELPTKFTSTAGKRGLIEFYSSTGTLAAIALRFNTGGSFTSAPAYSDSGSQIVGSTASTTVGVRSISMTPTSASSGQIMTGTVKLTTAAPAGGLIVNLSSSNTSVISVPSTLLVEGGSNSASFMITTGEVSTNQNVTITATYGTTTASTTATVKATTASTTSWFNKLVLTLAVQPSGSSISAAAMTIVPSSSDATYTGQMLGGAIMLDLADGTVSSDGLTYTFSSLASSGYRSFMASGVSLSVTSAVVTVTVSTPPTDTSVTKAGTVTGSFTLSGVTSGSPLTTIVTGTLTGTYVAN